MHSLWPRIWKAYGVKVETLKVQCRLTIRYNKALNSIIELTIVSHLEK